MIRNTKLMSASMREVRIRESHDCDKVHPKMNHLEWVAQNKDAANQDKDPVGAQHEEVLVEGKDDEPRTQVGTKHKIKPQYNTKTHKLITTPSGNVKVVPKSTPGMEAEETEWQKSKRLDREAQKRSEKQHDEREARYQRHQAAKKEEVENEVYKPNYGRRPFEPKNPKPHPAGITGPHNYPVNGDEKKKERDALIKAVAKSPKQQALKKKQDAAKNEEVEEALGLGGWKGSGIEKMPPVDKKTGKYVTGKSKIIRLPKKEEVGVEEGAGYTGGVRPQKPPHMRAGQTWKKIALIKKELERKKTKQEGAKELEARNAAQADKKQQGGSLKHKVWPASAKSMKMPKEEVEIDEVLRGTPGFYKKKGTPNLDASRAASKAKREKDNPKKFRTPQQAHHDKGHGWDRFKEEVEVDEQEMMQLKHKKSGQVMRMAKKVYQKQAHIQRERGWVPDSKQPHMRGGSALQHSYEAEGDTELQEMDFKVKIKGLPVFYVPGRSVGEIRAHMRKNLKRPQDVEWVERSTVAQKKKDFRLRAQDKDSG